MTAVLKLQQSRKIELFPDQKRPKREVYGHIRANENRILLIAPTGSGKTVIAASMIQDAAQKAKRQTRVVFLVDRECLIRQAGEKLDEFGVLYTVLQGSRVVDWSLGVVIASVQTIVSRLKKQAIWEILGEVGFVIADEAHKVAFTRAYQEIEDYYAPRGAILLGMTATPWRLKRDEYLGLRYDISVVADQPPNLIKIGRLVRGRAFALGDVFDLSHVDTKGGEYVESQLETQAIRPEALKIVVEKWIERGEDRATAAFCPGVQHAKLLTETFQQYGVAAEWQDGSTDSDERKAQTRRLELGETKVLSSCDTLTAGWDCPSVSCILFVTSTKSKARFFQGAGRAARPYPDKADYLLFDFGDNIRGNRHGSPSGYQDYSIGKKPPLRNPEDETITSKVCPDCDAIVSIFAKFCPECFHQFSQKQEELELDDPDVGDLVEIFDKLSISQAKYLRTCNQHAYREDLSPRLAVDRFRAEYGFVPPDSWHLHAVLGKQPSERKREDYRAYLLRHAPNEVNYRAWWRQETGEYIEVKQEKRRRR